MTLIIAALFLATVPAANWLIGNVGTVCVPSGPCLVPVAPGVLAPSGVLLIGVALVLRDALQERAGHRAVAGAILAGAVVSAFIAPSSLAVASVAAFVVAEGVDWAAYSAARRRSRALAVLVSGAAGAVADSAAFLWLAFGALDYIGGLVLGKLYATLAVAVVLARREAGR